MKTILMNYLILTLALAINICVFSQNSKCLKLFQTNIDNVSNKLVEYHKISAKDNVYYFTLREIDFDTINCKINVGVAIDSCSTNFSILLSKGAKLYLINSKYYVVSFSDFYRNQIFNKANPLSQKEIEKFMNSLSDCNTKRHFSGSFGGSVEFSKKMITYTPTLSFRPSFMIMPVHK